MSTHVRRTMSAVGAFGAICLTASAAISGDANVYGIGIEGFQNQFKEPDIGATATTNSGSMTGYYSHQFGLSFLALDVRGSYGTERYSATDNATNLPLLAGSVSGIPQWEFELRARYGRTYQIWDDSISPYIGIGILHHRDEGKGYFSNAAVGFPEAFDTTTFQFYVPVGVSYSHSFGDGWSVTPLAEADIIFYGDVDQHVTNTVLLGTFNQSADNTQHFGLGGRGELMFGKDLGGYDVEIGPFIRYWWVQKSDSTQYVIGAGPATLPVFEPSNNSTEIGGALKVLW